MSPSLNGCETLTRLPRGPSPRASAYALATLSALREREGAHRGSDGKGEGLRIRTAFHLDRLPALEAARTEYRRVDAGQGPLAAEHQRQFETDAASARWIKARGRRGDMRGQNDLVHPE